MYSCIIYFQPTLAAKPTLKELSNELESVQKWHSLGVKLELELHQLGTIEKDHYGDSERCKHEMLGCWLRSSELPTWKVVTDALHQIGEHAVALQIQRKYCSTSTSTGMCIYLFALS